VESIRWLGVLGALGRLGLIGSLGILRWLGILEKLGRLRFLGRHGIIGNLGRLRMLGMNGILDRCRRLSIVRILVCYGWVDILEILGSLFILVIRLGSGPAGLPVWSGLTFQTGRSL